MKAILSGNEAIARGAYEYGLHFASAYPGTPSTEILENISQYKEIDSQWSTNEKVAFEVAAGASIGGARSLVAMKHVGVNVAADPLMTFAYMGVNAGFILVSADDPSAHSSQNEQDNRLFAKFAKIPMLEPSDSQEAKDFVGEALEISEKFDTPVLLRVTTRICHSKSIVELGERKEVPIKPLQKDFSKYVMVPANAYRQHPVVEERLAKLSEFGNSYKYNKIEYKDKKIGIITSGISYQYAKEVFPEASFLKLGLSYPLPKKLIKEFSENVEEVYVIEELEPFLEEEIRAMGIKVTGKDKLPICYEYDINVLEKHLLGKEQPESILNKANLPPRPPVLCPGCPHRSTFSILNKLKVFVTGDIGCYTLGGLPPLNALHTCMCMGASIGNMLGIEKAQKENVKNKIAAVIGDSTFLHSGITGLIDLVYNKGIGTVFILDNGITAMTGHQENPATGKTLKGEDTVAVNLKAICEAVGIKNVVEVDAFNLEELNKVIKEELNRDEPSVVIPKGPCIFVAPKDVKRKLYKVNPELCKKCGACIRLGCPAIEKDEEGKSKINEILCLGCSLCAQVCPFKAISEVEE